MGDAGIVALVDDGLSQIVEPEHTLSVLADLADVSLGVAPRRTRKGEEVVVLVVDTGIASGLRALAVPGNLGRALDLTSDAEAPLAEDSAVVLAEAPPYRHAGEGSVIGNLEGLPLAGGSVLTICAIG